ncbi:hypothetical protein I4U23_007274 [Adineta vaga]|nr:hypothetical protein I4U23_007274 [Adineta vaga]
MANRKQTNDLKISLKKVRQTNWFDGIHELPINIDKELLDECSEMIQNFIDNERSLSPKPAQSKSKSRKQQAKKSKKSQIKATTKLSNHKSSRQRTKSNKSQKKLQKKTIPPFHHTQIISTNAHSCYPSVFPCYRSCGPIHCPKNKLPMPRDLWYRIVYSQALEQQLEDTIQTGDITQNNSQKSYRIDHPGYISETLPLEIEHNHDQSIDTTPWMSISNKTTQSTDEEPINYPKMNSIPNPSSTTIIILDNQPAIEKINSSSLLPKQSMRTMSNEYSSVTSPIVLVHPLYNQLVEYYNLQDISQIELFKRLNRRLAHIRQTLKAMSSDDIEIKLKYKRDALVKKRQTPVQSLTKDERIAMTELELNVYEYVQALDGSLSKYISINNINESECKQIPSISRILPTGKSVISLQSSITPSRSTFNTNFEVQPSTVSQSAALLSTTTTQFSDKTEKCVSWNHSLLSTLMNMFEHSTSLRKAQIHKQLARRYEHICNKAPEFNMTQLQAQINSKAKEIDLALVQNKNIHHPNEHERLRIAELELCLYELEQEQTQRNQSNKNEI